MIKKYEFSRYSTNTYLLIEGSKSIFFDPIGPIDDLKRVVEESDTELQGIVYTHGHFDHIASANEVYDAFQVGIYIHQDEKDFLFDAQLNLSGLFNEKFQFVHQEAVHYFTEDGEYEIAGIRLHIIHTPGHTKGGIIIQYGNEIITGDTLFQGSIGRTDLPTGDYQVLRKSLQKFRTFDPDTILHPGHGPSTSVKQELNTNPYLKD
ncbi:MAG TPA: MBL fold metallo-hydrolase [Eubacteriaceae bacterium]|nr:MBL fold metallo-hydrolase [Eubacteriaceae bacterium]